MGGYFPFKFKQIFNLIGPEEVEVSRKTRRPYFMTCTCILYHINCANHLPEYFNIFVISNKNMFLPSIKIFMNLLKTNIATKKLFTHTGLLVI